MMDQLISHLVGTMQTLRLSPKESIESLLRKSLALQMENHTLGIDAHLVYAQIGTDYSKHAMRLQEGRGTGLPRLDTGLLSFILSKRPVETGVQRPVSWPARSELVNAIDPLPADAEVWQRYTHARQALESAYLISFPLSRELHYLEFLQALHPQSERDECYKIYNAIRAFKPSDPAALAQEIGKAIGNLQFEPGFLEALDDALAAHGRSAVVAVELEPERHAVAVEEDPPVVIEAPAPQGEDPRPLSALCDEMQTFRVRNLMPPTASEMRVAKQLVLTALGQEIPEGLLYTSQEVSETPLSLEERATAARILQTDEFAKLFAKRHITQKSPILQHLARAAQRFNWTLAELANHLVAPMECLSDVSGRHFTALQEESQGHHEPLVQAIANL